MRVRPDQLNQHLQQKLAPLYLISGDEPLQVMEATDSVRARARDLGYSERQVLEVDKDFDWQQLKEAADSLSLFAEQRIMELRLPTGKPGRDGGKVLVEYSERPAEDTVLIITSGKLDKSANNSKWYKALDQVGVTVQCWPVDNYHMPNWIKARMAAQGMQPTTEAVNLLVERVEGNLLAAAQEIDKLRLLVSQSRVDVDEVADAVTDSSRFSIYDLSDAALTGDVARTAHIVSGLQAEGVEAVLALWALSREIRTLLNVAETAGNRVDAALAKAGVWAKRVPVMKKALSRHNIVSLRTLISHCAKTDRVIKGLAPGRAWDELLLLSLALAGIRQHIKHH